MVKPGAADSATHRYRFGSKGLLSRMLGQVKIAQDVAMMLADDVCIPTTEQGELSSDREKYNAVALTRDSANNEL